MRTPQAAEIYLRLSDLRREDLDDHGVSHSLEDGERRLRGLADRLGWQVSRAVVENDVTNGRPKPASAFKRRKVTLPDGSVGWRVIRPRFREVLARLGTGKADGMLALDLDRVVRDPRDLEDLIDIVEHHHVPVESESGSLRLASDADITMARVMVAMANKASRDTARRVAASRERQALAGEYGGGRRGFGFCAGPPPIPGGAAVGSPCPWHGGRDCRAGVTLIPAEAQVIADCSLRLLKGVALRELAAELRAAQVPTVSGVPWSAVTLREILLRPRNAGLVVYRGEILEGVTAPWEPIVTTELFYAVRDLLNDQSRRNGPGPAPRWLGSGIYRCGICTPPGTVTDRPTTCQVTLGGRRGHPPRYVCKARAHLTRSVARVDELVAAHIVYALTHPRAFELLAPPAPDVDVAGLRSERATIRLRLEQIVADEVLGLRTRVQVQKATKTATARIEKIDQILNASVGDDPLADLVNAPDPVAAWESLALANQRVIVDRLVTVTILPNKRPGRWFEPDSVSIVAKHALADR